MLRVDEEDRAEHPRRLRFDQPDDAAQDIGEGRARGDLLEDRALLDVERVALTASACHGCLPARAGLG